MGTCVHKGMNIGRDDRRTGRGSLSPVVVMMAFVLLVASCRSSDHEAPESLMTRIAATGIPCEGRRSTSSATFGHQIDLVACAVAPGVEMGIRGYSSSSNASRDLKARIIGYCRILRDHPLGAATPRATTIRGNDWIWTVEEDHLHDNVDWDADAQAALSRKVLRAIGGRIVEYTC